MTERLRFSPDILRRLGEELVPDIDQGIIELVKNAYDADATKCAITLEGVNDGHGSIHISDNGTGMDKKAIRSGWLVIGRSSKEKTLTPVYERVPVGDKGLGRLAALRLGRRVTLKTRPASKPGTEFVLTIDWDKFANAIVVEDVDLDITVSKTDAKPGTDIQVDEIEARIGRATVNKLARSLLLLSDPFEKPEKGTPDVQLDKTPDRDPGFMASLSTPEYADLAAKVGQSYFADAEYRIHATLNPNQTAVFNILDWKDDILHEYHSENTYHTTPFTFDLWVFILDRKPFSTRTSTLDEVRKWLKQLGGVHIYEDAIRVPPYGGIGDDWLELNLRRVRSPEMRPSTNTAVGRVRLSNTARSFIQKTDRIGYIENQSFLEMKRCCGDALDWAAREQIRERDRKRLAVKANIQQKTAKATVRLNKVLSSTIPDTERKKVESAITSYVKETEREAKSLREELQLYRSLATAGMTSAVFAHEIGRPLKLIDTSIQALQRLVPLDQQDKANRRIERLSKAKERLNSFINIPLSLLAKKKRRSGRVDVNKCVSNLMALIEPVTRYFKVEATIKLTDQYTSVNGSEALLEGVLLNLIMNSFNAFQREAFDQEQRRLAVVTDYNGSSVVIRVSDNAGGIDGVAIDEIWLPGVTSVPDGTGFGLTIVRDSINDLSGTIEAIAKSDFGGAEFTIKLPPMRDFFGKP